MDKTLSFYKKIFTSVSIGMVVCDDSGQCIEANEAMGRIIGGTREDVLSQNYYHIKSWEGTDVLETLLCAVKTNKTQHQEVTLTTSLGRQVSLDFHIIPFAEEEQNYLLVVVYDITKRKQAEGLLKESEEKFRQLSENINEVLWIVSPDWNELHYINPAYEKVFGKSCQSLYDNPKSWIDSVIVEDQQKLFDTIAGVNFNTMEKVVFPEYRIEKPDGEIRSILATGYPFKNEKGEVERVTGIAYDITLLKNAKTELLKSEERYRTLFENATDIIQIVRPDGQLLDVNPSWCNTLGYSQEEAKNLNVFDIIDLECEGECVVNFNRALTEGTTGIVETAFIHKDGGKIILEGSANCNYLKGQPSYVHCIFHDITDKRRMEDELIKMQKLESLGILAGGIAHDFNNILTALTGNLSLARMHVEPDGKVHKRIKEAEKASLRARDLTQQLLTFSRGGEPIKQLALIGELVKDSSQFILRGSNVKCEYLLPADLWLVELDEGQISQVLNNLVINADQAMPDGGTVTIRAENIHISSKGSHFLKGGDYVAVSVEDQGSGISEKYITKIFDPYFSTKHKGHGLGLATAYSIVNKHGGLLEAESELGKGSVFRFYLPASPKNKFSQASDGEGIFIGKGFILLMDDDEKVREISREMFEHLGCQVKTASDGRQALEIYSKAMQDKTPFDAVILDLTVPGGMGGKETMEELLKIDSLATVIVSSGYANDPIMAHYKDYGFSGVVPKPYKIEEVSKVLKKLLHSS